MTWMRVATVVTEFGDAAHVFCWDPTGRKKSNRFGAAATEGRRMMTTGD